ncbi:hypothetical protein Asulf_00971 [Archaeoglobus sulfaticallidus PM70-1]|uniref:Uncharacterized protein n=1 Tax=Archaeoglobus sulfaticallidus PM70-1 TaxID=387631 RepID=N0BLA4_9EURY|nr:hypothetical protein [Archaeoglobus sulfaticallidus]AGK60975.1 hypothetical protein Asulf_00971 [Archaeoglobus sulfaticallidus PM70-1]
MGTIINPANFDELFIECYYLTPDPLFSVDDAARVYTEWLERVEYVKTPIDPKIA